MTTRGKNEFKFLKLNQLDEPKHACIFCKSSRLFQTGVIAQRSPTVGYVECRDCYARFLDRQPTDVFLDQYYASDDYDRTLTTSPTKARIFAQKIISSEVKCELQSKLRAIRILDFGGGNGRLGLAVAEVISPNSYGSTHDVTVVDVFRPKEDLGARFIPASRLSELQSESFDIVLASASLEHVKDPGSVLQDLYLMCAPGGYLYFRVPSMFPLGRLFRQFLLYPEHLSHMSPRFWKEMPSCLGWSGRFIYSRPAPPDAQLRNNPLGYVIAQVLKFPARIEVVLRKLMRVSSPPRYDCSGGWEILFKK